MPFLKLTTQTATPMTPTPPHALSRSRRPTPSSGPLQSVSSMTVTCASHPVRLPVRTYSPVARRAGGLLVVLVAEGRSSEGPLPVSIARGAGASKRLKGLEQARMLPLLLRRQVDLDLQGPKWVTMMTFHISTVQGISERRSTGSYGGDPEHRRAVTPILKWTEECPSILHLLVAS